MAETGSGEATIMRLFEAMDHRDEAALRALTTDDFTMTWPQSGERFRGRENALAALSVQDDAPTPVGEPRIMGGGDTWVVMMPLQYAEAPVETTWLLTRAAEFRGNTPNGERGPRLHGRQRHAHVSPTGATGSLCRAMDGPGGVRGRSRRFVEASRQGGVVRSHPAKTPRYASSSRTGRGPYGS